MLSATTYNTTTTFATIAGINRMVLTWETAETSGLVEEMDLINLSFKLYNSTTLVFQDDAIVNSVGMPLDEVARVISTGDVIFGYSFVSGLDNFSNFPGDHPGTTYVVYSLGEGDIEIAIERWVDGSRVSSSDTVILSQSTTAIPEPGTYAAVLGVGSLFVAAFRRRKARRNGIVPPLTRRATLTGLQLH
jgi:hypothetical protein